METGDSFENARAEREARDAVPGRAPGSRTSAIQDALRRYLAARTYRDRDREESSLPRTAKTQPTGEQDDEH
jgi:hypothetical protein